MGGASTGKFQSESGFTGFFSYEDSKVITITPGQPNEGWVTLGFSDESDTLDINGQMFYVPEEQFKSAIQAYLKEAK